MDRLYTFSRHVEHKMEEIKNQKAPAEAAE